MVGCAKRVAVRQGIGLIGGRSSVHRRRGQPSLPAADHSRQAEGIWPVIAGAGEQEAAEQLSAKVLLTACCRDGTPALPVICLSAGIHLIAQGMAEPQVNLVLDSQTDLGEGPVWDERTGRLYFVDINKQQIHVYTPSAQGADKHFTISTPVSC